MDSKQPSAWYVWLYKGDLMPCLFSLQGNRGNKQCNYHDSHYHAYTAKGKHSGRWRSHNLAF